MTGLRREARGVARPAMGLAHEVKIRSRMTLVLVTGRAMESWTVGSPAGDGDGAAIGVRVVTAGPAASTVYLAGGRWARVPADLTDAEAVLLPLAAQMAEAVRQAGVSLGDPLLVLGEGLRGRLAALAAARRGAMALTRGDGAPIPPGSGGQDRPSAALVVEGGVGLEAAACRGVRPRGSVILAMGSAGGAGEFDFYRNLQQTGARLVGIAPWPRALAGPAFAAALHLARAFWAGGGTLPIVGPEAGLSEGRAEYLVRWDA